SRLHSGSNRRGIEKITLFSAPDLEADVELADTQNVVLAAGGMGNAQILLASDDGTGAEVGNERDQVGRYLMEHPHLPNCATFVLRSDFSLGNPPAEFGGSFPVLVPNDELFFDTEEIDASFEIIEAQLDVDDAIQQFVIERLGGDAKAFSLFGRSEMMADPENRVRRIAATDPAGLPRLKATCVVDSSSIRSMLTYLERLGVSLSEQGVGRLRINDLDLMASLSGGGHTMGTTRMGTDPATSVTDPNCRVHGYRNLFVAGSSLFPTGGYANPTLTIIALAARLGDFLGKAA
ncbi:MAG: GMC oxidoreductase, partial [Pseudomonadota bacterium]